MGVKIDGRGHCEGSETEDGETEEWRWNKDGG
jgi:hypothetical protein